MKKLFLTTLMAVSAAFGYAQTPYWSYGFDNGALTDGVGNDDLTQNGSSLSTVADRFSNADDAVLLGGDVLEGGSGNPNSSFSVSFWVKDVVNDATLRIMVDQFTDHGYSIRLENGLVKAVSRMAYYSGSSGWQPLWSGTVTQTSSTNIADGNWHHIVYTARKYGPSGSTYSYEYKLYIDGAQEAANVANVNTLPPAGHRGIDPAAILHVGNNSSGTYPYENTIDDIAFFSTNLSAAQVTDLYNARPAQVIYVDEDASGANDGSSWTDAFVSLKDATDYATVAGDEIWVAEGTYTPHASTRTESFRIMPGVSLYGGFNGTETSLSQRDWRSYETVLSGDLNGNDNSNVAWSEGTRSENSYRVVVLDDAGSNTLIDGVTISGGHANHSSDNNYNRGAAIRMENAANSIDVRNCIIENNVANLASGVMAEFNSSSAHTANIENCIFRNNVSRYGSSYMVSVLAGTGTATVSNCLMKENQAIDLPVGDGFSGPGGFLDSRAGSTLNAEVVNCTFIGNVNTGTHSANSETSTIAARRHGGTFNLTVANCVFDGNTASKSIGRMNTTNCPNTALLVNNVRPDVASTVCSTSSISETALAPTLDADGRPLAGSNTIDGGANSYAVGTEDIDGNTRILAGTIDIGAFEFDPNGCNQPSITTQPADETVCEGSAATFTISASGDGLTYQWRRDGQNISGATSSSYSIASAATSAAGDYTVVVTGTCGAETSSVAELVVNAETSITTHPIDEIICEGAGVTFSVSATGDNLSYQWKKGGTPIAAAWSDTYVIGTATVWEAGNYTVEVTGTCGSVTSNVAELIVNSPTTITSQPQGLDQCQNTTATFSVGVTGANISYQWQLDGQDLSGQTFPNLNVNGVDQTDEGDYTCIVTGACGVETSDVAPLNVLEATAISIQSTNQSICEGGDFSFSVVAAGSNLTYQWQLGGVDMNGETSGFISFTNVGPTLAGSYTVDVSGDCGAVSSNAMVLTVTETPEPVISENGGMLETGVFDTYQWYLDGNLLNGETNATVAVGAPGDYTVEVTENGCTGTSAPYTPMTVGIEENTSVSISTYPNPFNDILNLNLEAFEGQLELEVMDMTGRVVFTSVENAAQIQLNLYELTAGAYALSVRGEDGKVAVSRLIKN